MVTCTKYSVEFAASTAGTGYPTFYDPRQMTAPALAGSTVTTYDSWLYVIDTAQKGAISGPEDVQKGMVKAMACPTAPELIKKVTGDIYAELFKGFAMDKEDNDMLMPYQQKMKGEKDATLEQRLMA